MSQTRNKTITLTPEKIEELYVLTKKENELQNGDFAQDCIIAGDTFSVLPRLCHDSYDLIIADPPYNIAKSYNGSLFGKKSITEYERYTREWLSMCAPLLRDGGSIYVCCDWTSSICIGQVLSEFFTVRNRITWQREKGRGAAKNWKNGMEDIWFATKGDSYTFNLDAVKVRKKVLAPYRDGGTPKDWHEESGEKVRYTCPSNFWDDITIPFWSMAENTPHPTQKPEKLLAKLILASSNENDRVLDPFCGSGSTCVTAKKLGRHFTGIEREKPYCAFSVHRLQLAETDRSIQGYEDGVFYERNGKQLR